LAEMMLARVLRCRFCHREMRCSPLAYEQNPFCADCLPDRVAAAAPVSGMRWELVGDYFILRAAETPPSDALEHPSD
jgi:hypothetical protein